MARWERDPVLRRRLSWLLAGGEVAALTLNFYLVFAAYSWRTIVAISPTLLSARAFRVLAVAATCVFLVIMAVQGYLFVRGRGWARVAFLIENAAMIFLGLVWFVHSILGQGEPNVYALWGGLILPSVTLFPLLWPLKLLRPMPPAAGAG